MLLFDRLHKKIRGKKGGKLGEGICMCVWGEIGVMFSLVGICLLFPFFFKKKKKTEEKQRERKREKLFCFFLLFVLLRIITPNITLWLNWLWLQQLTKIN